MASTSQELSKAGEAIRAAPGEQAPSPAPERHGSWPQADLSALRAASPAAQQEFKAEALAALLNQAITGSDHPNPAQPLAPNYEEIRNLLAPLDNAQLAQVDAVLKERWGYNFKRLIDTVPAIDAIGLKRLWGAVAAQRPIHEHTLSMSELGEREDLIDLMSALDCTGKTCRVYRDIILKTPKDASPELLLEKAIKAQEFALLSKEKEPLRLIDDLEKQFARMENRLVKPVSGEGFELTICEAQRLKELIEAAQKLVAVFEKDGATSVACQKGLGRRLLISVPSLLSFFEEYTEVLCQRLAEKKCSILEARLKPAPAGNPWEDLTPLGD